MGAKLSNVMLFFGDALHCTNDALLATLELVFDEALKSEMLTELESKMPTRGTVEMKTCLIHFLNTHASSYWVDKTYQKTDDGHSRLKGCLCHLCRSTISKLASY